MAAMEMTVVSTAMPTVVGDLGGIHFYSWVFTAYLLTSTVTVPLYGKLADLYGRKPVLLFGIGVFLVGSMASGLARGIGTLIAFRAVQGLGAGAMQPTTLTIVGDIYNLEERSRMQGVLGGSPTEAGTAITPMVIGWPIASAISGRLLPRVGYRPLIHSGLAISAAAAVALALLLRPGASLHVPQAMSALFGVGLGLANTALLIAVQTSVEWRQRGVATASTMFARTIGGTLAVGALGAILSAAL